MNIHNIKQKNFSTFNFIFCICFPKSFFADEQIERAFYLEHQLIYSFGSEVH